MFQKNFTPKKYWNKYEVFHMVVSLLTLVRLTKKTSSLESEYLSFLIDYYERICS